MPLASRQPTLEEVLQSFGARNFPIYMNGEDEALRVIRVDAEETCRDSSKCVSAPMLTAVREIYRRGIDWGDSYIRLELEGNQMVVFQVGEHMDMSRVVYLPVAEIGKKIDVTCVRIQGGLWYCGFDPFSDEADPALHGQTEFYTHAAEVFSRELAGRGFVVMDNNVKGWLANQGKFSLWQDSASQGPWAEQALLTLYRQPLTYREEVTPLWLKLETAFNFTDLRSAEEFDLGLSTLPAPPKPGEPGYGSPWIWQAPQ